LTRVAVQQWQWQAGASGGWRRAVDGGERWMEAEGRVRVEGRVREREQRGRGRGAGKKMVKSHPTYPWRTTQLVRHG
jgi:hypothetical protein